MLKENGAGRAGRWFPNVSEAVGNRQSARRRRAGYPGGDCSQSGEARARGVQHHAVARPNAQKRTGYDPPSGARVCAEIGRDSVPNLDRAVAEIRTLYRTEDARWWRSLSILLAAATCLILPGEYREPFAEGVHTCLVGLTEVGSIGEPFAGCTQGIEIVKVSLGSAI